MNKPFQHLQFWAPRILCLLFAAFISLFALDVFGENHGFWQTVFALLMHLLPTGLLLVILALSCRWEWIGGILFPALGGLHLVTCWGRFWSVPGRSSWSARSFCFVGGNEKLGGHTSDDRRRSFRRFATLTSRVILRPAEPPAGHPRWPVPRSPTAPAKSRCATLDSFRLVARSLAKKEIAAQSADSYSPAMRLTDLPSLPIRVVGMATAAGAAPSPPWEKTSPSSITLTLGESPTYLIMEKAEPRN